jgi:hypothetical protein
MMGIVPHKRAARSGGGLGVKTPIQKIKRPFAKTQEPIGEEYSIMKRLIQQLKKIRSENTGAAMIEAAFVLPIFILMMFAALQLALLMFYSFILERAMFDATRRAKVAAPVEEIYKMIEDRSYGILKPEDVIITTDLRVNFAADWKNAPVEQCVDAAGVAIAGKNCPCAPDAFIDANGNGLCDAGAPTLDLGAPGDIVSFIAFYKAPLIAPFMEQFFANIGTKHLIAAGTVVRNEPAVTP